MNEVWSQLPIIGKWLPIYSNQVLICGRNCHKSIIKIRFLTLMTVYILSHVETPKPPKQQCIVIHCVCRDLHLVPSLACSAAHWVACDDDTINSRYLKNKQSWSNINYWYNDRLLSIWNINIVVMTSTNGCVTRNMYLT